MLSATDIFNTLPAARSDLEAQASIMDAIKKQYGDESTFFAAVGKELGVSPEHISNILLRSSEQEQPPVVDNTPANSSEAPQRSVQAPKVPDFKVTSQADKYAAPKQLDAFKVYNQSNALQTSGMAQGQAMNKAAQQSTNEIKAATGGYMSKRTLIKPPSKGELDIQLASFDTKSIPKEALDAAKFAFRGKARGLLDSVPTEDAKPDAAELARMQKEKEYLARMSPAGKQEAEDDSDDRIRKEEGLPAKKYAEGGMVEDDLPMTTDEEKADDIPAKLSEGEFVMPAYAVKYYGVQHLMEMLDTAKIHMMELEEAGETPEEEAMESPEQQEEEQEYGMEMHNPTEEMAKGGMVKAIKLPKAGAVKSAGYKGIFKAPKAQSKIHVPRGPNTMPYGIAAQLGETNPNKGIKYARGGLVKHKEGC